MVMEEMKLRMAKEKVVGDVEAVSEAVCRTLTGSCPLEARQEERVARCRRA